MTSIDQIYQIVDRFSIHTPRGGAKGTLARRVMKNKLSKTLSKWPQPTQETCLECGNNLFFYDDALRCIYDGYYTKELIK